MAIFHKEAENGGKGLKNSKFISRHFDLTLNILCTLYIYIWIHLFVYLCGHWIGMCSQRTKILSATSARKACTQISYYKVFLLRNDNMKREFHERIDF